MWDRGYPFVILSTVLISTCSSVYNTCFDTFTCLNTRICFGACNAEDVILVLYDIDFQGVH